LLKQVNSDHEIQSNRAPAHFTLGIVRLNDCLQSLPRDDAFHFR